jgi:hypothetical protein
VIGFGVRVLRNVRQHGAERLDHMEPYYPLHALVSSECFLVQLGEYVKPEHIFTETRISPRIRHPGSSPRDSTAK